MLVEEWGGAAPLPDDMEALAVVRGWEFLDLAGVLTVHACDGEVVVWLPQGWTAERAEAEWSRLAGPGGLSLTVGHAVLHGTREEAERHLTWLGRHAFAEQPEERRPQTGNFCLTGAAAAAPRTLRWLLWTAFDAGAGRLATIDLTGPWGSARDAASSLAGFDRLRMLIENAEFRPPWASPAERAGEILPLRTIAVGDVALRVPPLWLHAPLADGRWLAWEDRHDGRGTGPLLRLGTEALESPALLHEREDRAAALSRGGGAGLGPGWRAAAPAPGRDGPVMRFERPGTAGLAHLWAGLLTEAGRGAAAGRGAWLTAQLDEPVGGGPAAGGLLRLLDSEIGRARLLPRPDRGASPDPDDPFAVLKTVTAFDAVRLRVPAIWDSYYDEKARMWCCCRRDVEEPDAEYTGTLWIDRTRIACRAPRDMLYRMAEESAAEMAEQHRDGFRLYPVERLADGPLVRCSHLDVGKDGEVLAFDAWHRYRWLGGDALEIVHFTLVRTRITVERPGWQRLVETMDREIRAAALAPPER